MSRSRAILLALVALALAAAAGPAYTLQMGSPLFRNNALPSFALFTVGSALALLVARRRRTWPFRVVAAIPLVLAGLFAAAFFGLTGVPVAPQFAALTAAPGFTLPDQDGRPVSLAATLERGPVLLVFYRGFW